MSKLEYLITELIAASKQRAHVPVKRTLRNGLTLEISSDAQSVTLIIHRPDAPPSDLEMRTVLKHWPYPTGEVNYRPILHNRRNALMAEIPHNKIEQMKFA